MKPKTQTALTPRLPHEIIAEVLDHLATNSSSLRSCPLVSKSWVSSRRQLLFHTVVFTKVAMERWLEMFPVPEESPACVAKDLSVQTGWPHQFFEYTLFRWDIAALQRIRWRGVTNMLLEIPTGIHFTELQMERSRNFLSSNVRLLEACGHTLVRLSYMVDSEHKFYSFSWPSWFWRAKGQG